MKNHVVRRWWWSVFVAVLLAAPSSTQADITMQITSLSNPAPSLASYMITLNSTGGPIERVGAIQIDGLVHQATAPLTSVSQTVFYDDISWWPYAPLAEYDTHLLLRRNQFSAIVGSPLEETNDQSNPAGLSDSLWRFGMGTFGQGTDGYLILDSSYQSTSLDFLQVVASVHTFGLGFAMKVYADGAWHHISTPYLGPHDGIVVDPASLDFGNVRVGTTAVEYTQAWLSEAYPTEEEEAAFRDAWPEPFGPSPLSVGEGDVQLSRAAKKWVSFSFSPESRGEFTGTGRVGGPFVIRYTELPLSGTGVGPVFDSEQASGTAIEFSGSTGESVSDVFLKVGNLTDDPELGDLTELNVAASIEGDAAEAFEIIDAAILELLVGQTSPIHLRFNSAGLAPDDYEALLVLRTDIGAACGATHLGETYSFTLRATAVPEPSALVGLLGLVASAAVFRTFWKNALALWDNRG